MTNIGALKKVPTRTALRISKDCKRTKYFEPLAELLSAAKRLAARSQV